MFPACSPAVALECHRRATGRTLRRFQHAASNLFCRARAGRGCHRWLRQRHGLSRRLDQDGGDISALSLTANDQDTTPRNAQGAYLGPDNNFVLGVGLIAMTEAPAIPWSRTGVAAGNGSAAAASPGRTAQRRNQPHRSVAGMTVAGVPRCHVAVLPSSGAAGEIAGPRVGRRLRASHRWASCWRCGRWPPAAANNPPARRSPKPDAVASTSLWCRQRPKSGTHRGRFVYPPTTNQATTPAGLNHVIRSLDTLTYEVRYRVLNQDATGVRCGSRYQPGAEFAAPASPAFGNLPVPAYCAASSTLTGNVLDCLVGPVTQGVTRSVLLQARPKFGTVDGTVIRLQAGIEASNQQSTGAVVRSGYQDPLTEATISCDVTRLGTTVSLAPAAMWCPRGRALTSKWEASRQPA